MKLHARDAAALHYGGERLAVFGDGGGVGGHGRDVAVRVVDLCARRDAGDDGIVAHERQAVPADVRDLDAEGPAKAGRLVLSCGESVVVRGVRL